MGVCNTEHGMRWIKERGRFLLVDDDTESIIDRTYHPHVLCSGMLAGGFFSQSGAGGDSILLVACSCDDSGVSSASCNLTYYHDAHSTRAGEVWGDVAGTPTDQYTLEAQDGPVEPLSNTGDYQMKWDDPTTGDAPDSGDTKAVWRDMGAGSSFQIGWSASGFGQEVTGTVTVSIRKGTGSTIDTAIWDGSATTDEE